MSYYCSPWHVDDSTWLLNITPVEYNGILILLGAGGAVIAGAALKNASKS